MKKRKLLLICLCAAMLAGCGNRDERVPAAPAVVGEDEEKSSTASGSGVSPEDDTKAESKDSAQPEPEESAKAESEDSAQPEPGDSTKAESEDSAQPKNGTKPEPEQMPGSNAGSGTEGEDTVNGPEPAFVFGDKATMNNQVGERELPIYCVDTEEKKIALSFDAAWGNEDTAQLLAILKEHDLHVTFFMTGGWVESYPEDVKAILEAGHDLGNHSENHKNMSELSDEEKREEILSVHRKVKEITGYDMFLFRPPYGDYDNALIDVLKDCEYYAIQWDVDSLDWKNEGVDAILKTVTEHKNLGNGSIILCHNGGEYTAEALDELITELENQGYEIVPVSELIYPDHYHMDVQGRQIPDE